MPDNSFSLQYIKPDDLKAYLKKTGWIEEPFPRADLLKFKSPQPLNTDNEYIEIFIPTSEESNSYEWMVEHALKNVSSFENSDLADIVMKISNFADCLKTKILEAKNGMIPLNQGIFLYRSTFDLITFSACGEFEPDVKKFPRKLEKASKYAETSLLGQSELGSYVANVYLPLGRHPPDYPWFITDPFPRKVILRILRGLGDLVDSATEERPDPIIDNYNKGLNSNMCNAVVDIINAGMGNKVIMSAVLEPAFDVPDDISVNFILSPADKYYLNEAINIFEGDKPQEEERSFIGYVKLLSRPEERDKGVIVLISPDPVINKSISIRMELRPSDYHKAVDAHDLKQYVKVMGILEKVGYRWSLKDAHDVEVFDNDSEEPWNAFTRSLKNNNHFR